MYLKDYKLVQSNGNYKYVAKRDDFDFKTIVWSWILIVKTDWVASEKYRGDQQIRSKLEITKISQKYIYR